MNSLRTAPLAGLEILATKVTKEVWMEHVKFLRDLSDGVKEAIRIGRHHDMEEDMNHHDKHT